MISIVDKIILLICDHGGYPQEQVLPETKFSSLENFDSFDRVELVMSIEEEFDVDICDEEAGDFFNKTVKEMADAIDRELSK